MAARPLISQLHRDQCLDLISRARVGRVALNVGALPAIRTVRFALTGDHVVFRAAPGSMLGRAAAGVVAFQVDHLAEHDGEGWWVQVIGRSEAVTHPGVLDELERLPLTPWAEPDGSDAFFRLPLDSVSGQHVRWPEGA